MVAMLPSQACLFLSEQFYGYAQLISYLPYKIKPMLPDLFLPLPVVRSVELRAREVGVHARLAGWAVVGRIDQCGHRHVGSVHNKAWLPEGIVVRVRPGLICHAFDHTWHGVTMRAPK